MIQHNARKKKIWRKKFAFIASRDRQFTVKNTKKGISPVVKHKRIGGDVPKEKIITSPYSGIQYVMTNPHTIHGEKYGVTVTGYDWVPIDEYKTNSGLLWEHKKYPQPKNIGLRYKDPPKMNKVQYMEKLVEHKLAKWERKNPQPCPDDDLFKVEYQVQWYKDRDAVAERFRDFVVSIYDKLPLTGRFKVGEDKYKEKPVAELKDFNGEGHNVNSLEPGKSKLLDKAQKVTNKVHAKNVNLVSTNLKDHKRKRGRILLPEKQAA